MSLTPEQMRIVRRARMECILLGMALAKDGDRKLVLETCKTEDFRNEAIALCIEGLQKKEKATVVRGLARLGVEADGSVAKELIKRVTTAARTDRAVELVERSLVCDVNPDSLREAFTDALSLLGEKTDG